MGRFCRFALPPASAPTASTGSTTGTSIPMRPSAFAALTSSDPRPIFSGGAPNASAISWVKKRIGMW